MEPASFAVGIASLASLFSVCVDGYSAVRTAKSLGKDAVTLLCQLEVEEARFITWGRSVGISAAHARPSADIPLEHVGTVVKVLAQMSQLMSDAKELRQKYGILVEEINENTRREPGVQIVSGLRMLRERLFLESKQQPKLAASLQQSTPILNKLRWVLTDKESFESFISTLKGFNDSLLSMQSAASNHTFRADFKMLCLESSKTNDILQLQAMQRVKYGEIALPAGHKALRLRLESEFVERFDHSTSATSVTSLPGADFAKFQISRENVYIESTDESRSFGLYQTKKVLLEWRIINANASSETNTQQTLRRLALVSKLLHVDTPRPPEFHALSCFGFLADSHPLRFAFVYAIPPSATNSNLFSLYQLLNDDSPTRFRPSQTSRITLACRLATSLLQLHATGWLHKAFRSHNVLMFGSIKSAAEISAIVQKCYLVGHGYARLASNAPSTEPVFDGSEPYYRHPDLSDQDKRPEFRKKYDIYALGVLLLEIAYWKPLEKLVRTKRTPDQAAKKLSEYVASGDLAHWMGNIFSEVTEWCLMHGAADDDDEVAFYEKVVRPLERCTI